MANGNDKVSLGVLDALTGYDPETHSFRGIPQIAASAPRTVPTVRTPTSQWSKLESQPFSDTTAPGPKPAFQPGLAQGTQAPTNATRVPTVTGEAPNIQTPMPTGLPSVAFPQGQTPTLTKPKESGWQKLAHGLETAGNIAGNAFVPGVMANIPGTQLNKEFEQKRQAGLEASQARTGLEQAQTWQAMHPGEAETAKQQAEFNFKDAAMRAAGYGPGSEQYNKNVFGLEPQAPLTQAFNADLAKTNDPMQSYRNVLAAQNLANPQKGPIGQQEADRRAGEVQQFANANRNWTPEQKQGFLKAFTPQPGDTPEIADKRIEAAEKAAQMSATEVDKEIQRMNAETARMQAEAARQFQENEKRQQDALQTVEYNKDGELLSGSLADANAAGGKGVRKTTPQEEQKARDAWTQYGRWMDNAQAAADSMGAWDNPKDKQLAIRVQNQFFKSIDAAPFGVGVHFDAAYVNAFQNNRDYKNMSPAAQEHMQNMAQIWSDAINLMKEETGAVPRGEQFLQRESAILPQADKTQAMNRTALKQFTDRIHKDAKGKARPGDIAPLGDLKQTHSFTLNGKNYSGVSEADYNEAKKKPGFSEQ